jgi:hypothetical protein
MFAAAPADEGAMESISRPMQIALAVVLAFAALWFVALRPHGDSGKSSSAPTAPGATGLGNAVNGAKGAVAKSDASAKQTQAAAGTAANTTSGAANSQAPTSSSTAASPGASVAVRDRSKPLLAELKAGKVVVLLFWNPRASDDKSVHAVLRQVDRHGGKVAVHSASISRVADYSAITSGVQVLGSPTALVIDRKGNAKAVTGFNDARAIDQAAGDALAGKLAA